MSDRGEFKYRAEIGRWFVCWKMTRQFSRPQRAQWNLFFVLFRPSCCSNVACVYVWNSIVPAYSGAIMHTKRTTRSGGVSVFPRIYIYEGFQLFELRAGYLQESTWRMEQQFEWNLLGSDKLGKNGTRAMHCLLSVSENAMQQPMTSPFRYILMVNPKLGLVSNFDTVLYSEFLVKCDQAFREMRRNMRMKLILFCS